jgi:myo-inositol-1(or 4)-monophosphatase
VHDILSALEKAEAAAREAGRAILKYYKKTYDVRDKGADSPVTSADLEANQILHKRLQCPDFGWLSEESADSPDRLNRTTLWVVDPLDGTRDFLLGTDEFAISIGLVHDGRPLLGVVYVPPLDLLYTAARGHGAHLNGTRIVPSPQSKVSEARLIASRSESERDGLGEVLKQVRVRHVDYVGSAALKMARVAAGETDAYVTLTPKNEWDFCAGEAIIEEAGGRVTDGEGNAFRYNRKRTLVPNLLASNGALHSALLETFRPFL